MVILKGAPRDIHVGVVFYRTIGAIAGLRVAMPHCAHVQLVNGTFNGITSS